MILTAEELPIEAYHDAVKDGWLSKTSLKHFAEFGPKWWEMAYVSRVIEKPRPGGAEQGAALDCYLTEGPRTFEARYPEIPSDAPRRPTKAQLKAKKPSEATLDAIAWWSKWDAEHIGTLTLDAEDRAILYDAVEAVQTCPYWDEIRECTAQLTCRRWEKGLGVGLQSRPDWLSKDRRTLFDLKKTRDLARFGAQAIDLDYHLQAAIAAQALAGMGDPLERAFLVAVEWEHGARCEVLRIPDVAMIAGDARMSKIAADIAYRMKHNDWRAVAQSGELMLDIPPYMLRKMESAGEQ